VDHALVGIGGDRFASAAGRQMASGVLLPVVNLSANLRDFDAAMPFMDRAEGRARLDGLQLLRVADKNDLRPASAVMLTMREVGPDGFGQKERDWNRTELVEQ